MTNPFSTPASGEKTIIDENLGRLFMVTPREVEQGVKTIHGETDALIADVVIFDEKGTEHEVHTNTRIFQKVLIGSLKSSIGKPMPVLGVLGKGEKKPGKSAPWVLSAPSQAQVDLALAYYNSNVASNPFE
jgi:hypothetical protein